LRGSCASTVSGHYEKRHLETWFRRFPGMWYHGDCARIDEDGHWFLHGRTGDALKMGAAGNPSESGAVAALAHPLSA
jgi:acetyl-CoA synthetase